MSRYSSNPFDDDDGGGFGGGGSSRGSKGNGMGRSGHSSRAAYENDYRGSSRGRQGYDDSRGGMGYGGGSSSYSYQPGRGRYDDDYGRGEPPPMTEEEFQYRKQEAIRKMEDSSFNSLRTLNDCVRMGTETTEELDRQAEALDRVETRLDEIHVGLDKGERNLKKIKSPFGGFMNYFSKRKSVNEVTDPKDYKPPSGSSRDVKFSVGGGKEKAQARAQSQQAYKSTGSEVVDKNLDQMGRMLDDLKGIGELIGTQLDDSEQQIDRVAYKMERDDVKLQKLNKGINKELQK